MTRWRKAAAGAALALAAGAAYWRLAIPTHRVAVRSELVMLGDLDGDARWTEGDLAALRAVEAAPRALADEVARRLDLNRNGLVDEEDQAILEALVAAGGDPYAADRAGQAAGRFPRPRELYRFRRAEERWPPPRWALPAAGREGAAGTWAGGPRSGAITYAQALEADILAETVRLELAYRRREGALLPIEREYAEARLRRVEALRRGGDRFELLLALMALVEDAETLQAPRGPDPSLRLLAFRDHLRALLASEALAAFEAGRQGDAPILEAVEGYLAADLGLVRDLGTLGPARDLSRPENYLQRAEWQYHKSAAREADFLALIDYAQHDPRYLRAVSRTSRRHGDPLVENHDLAMILLFREALRIEGGDKKRAVGLLDEAIRIPYAWMRPIPREALPGSLALDNFLLPGNMEDGVDKSRHWNVFGGLCLYKSPQEAVDLALRRELQDYREAGATPAAMRELLRDLVADLNGMYHVMTVDPGLAGAPPSGT